MKFHLLLWPLGIAGLLVMAAPKTLLPHPRPATDASFTPDKGKFRILYQGNEAGSEEFDLEAAGSAWVLREQTVFRVAGSPETRTSGELRMSADGTPQRYTWSADGSKKASGSVNFEDGAAKTSINVSEGKQPIQQDFKFASPRVAVLDNNLYAQYAIFGRIYDWQAKGKQTFPVLIPQDATPGSIDVESIGAQTVDGAHLEALRVHSTDLEIELYFDAKFRLMRLEVPAAKVVIVRQ